MSGSPLCEVVTLLSPLAVNKLMMIVFLCQSNELSVDDELWNVFQKHENSGKKTEIVR